MSILFEIIYIRAIKIEEAKMIIGDAVIGKAIVRRALSCSKKIISASQLYISARKT
jgi:hypothetical protein